MKITEVRPMLEVSDLDETIKFYQDILCFNCTNRIDDYWASVARDGFSMMFFFFGKPKPSLTGSIYIFCDDVDAIWNQLKHKVEIAYPIETFEYGMRDFTIIDPNGYSLQFGMEGK